MLRRHLRSIPMLIMIYTTFAILLSSSFGLQINQSVWAGTFPGPNGQIAFAGMIDSEGDTTEILVMNADGSGVTRLTDNAGYDLYPSWSPDGTKIAFSTDR